MTLEQQHALMLRNTDIQGAIQRLGGDEQLYISCLMAFVEDPTMNQLNDAIMKKSWDDAFTAAHALKGLAGNMGFVPFMHSLGQLVIIIRGGRTQNIKECLALVNSNYRDIVDAINNNFTL